MKSCMNCSHREVCRLFAAMNDNSFFIGQAGLKDARNCIADDCAFYQGVTA